MAQYVGLDRALYLGRTVGLPASRQLAVQFDYLRVVGSVVKAPLDRCAVCLKRIRAELEALGRRGASQLCDEILSIHTIPPSKVHTPAVSPWR